MIGRSSSAPSSLSLIASVMAWTVASGVTRAEERVDLAAVHRIKAEAFQGSAVMDHLFHLTDVNGPRLSGSPAYHAAAAWSVRSLRKWGVRDARLEPWGTFGRGWSLERYSAHVTKPAYAPLFGVPLAWSAATRGAVSGDLVAAPLFTADEQARRVGQDLERLAARVRDFAGRQKGKLGGKIVLIDPVRDLRLPIVPAGERYDAPGLVALETAPEPFLAPPLAWPITALPEDLAERDRLFEAAPYEVIVDHWERRGRVLGRLHEFLRAEGALAVLATDRRGDGGIVFAEEGGSWESDAPIPPPSIALPPESYARLARLVERGLPVTVELEVASRFHDDVTEGRNVVAEIPGGRRKAEVVMLGAHLDSWHGATGATDNAAGCAVVLEAMRILKTLGLPLDRTVRLALWGGEEQGLYGSRGYVRERFGDPVTMRLKPEHARLSAYFNIDNGAGRIRGVYLQGNDMARPLFEAWLAPFADHGAATISIADTTDTDHESFDSVGLPGFQFIQDPLDYMTRSHHSNLDLYDRIQPGDLMQASAVLAAVVYHAANRADLVPRKTPPRPLPPPRPLSDPWIAGEAAR